MKTETEVRRALHQWASEVADTEVDDSTPLFADGLLQSIHVMDLILFIEELGEKSLDIENLGVGVFHDIDTIWRNFFSNDGGRDV